MKQHLQAAVRRYKQEVVNINPISEIDAEIITELGQAFLKLGQTKLKEIVDKWKYLKDEEIRDMLLDWHLDTSDSRIEDGESIDIPITKQEKESMGFVIHFIDFQGEMLIIRDILSFTKGMRYDTEDAELVWEIVVNKNCRPDFPYTNKTFGFRSEKLRDDAWGDLREKLEATGIIVFVE